MPGEAVCSLRVVADDLRDVQSVFDDLRAYSKHVDGRIRRTDAAREFATALPPGCDVQDKYGFVAYLHGRPVGLLDVIVGYPVPGTAFIGLLAVKEDLHGTGIGRSLYSEAERFMRDDLQAHTARLAVVETDAVGGFWEKMGFEPTGERKPYAGEAILSRSILMEKTIRSASE